MISWDHSVGPRLVSPWVRFSQLASDYLDLTDVHGAHLQPSNHQLCLSPLCGRLIMVQLKLWLEAEGLVVVEHDGVRKDGGLPCHGGPGGRTSHQSQVGGSGEVTMEQLPCFFHNLSRILNVLNFYIIPIDHVCIPIILCV